MLGGHWVRRLARHKPGERRSSTARTPSHKNRRLRESLQSILPEAKTDDTIQIDGHPKRRRSIRTSSESQPAASNAVSFVDSLPDIVDDRQPISKTTAAVASERVRARVRGSRVGGRSWIVLYGAANELEHPRLGLTVSRESATRSSETVGSGCCARRFG